MEITLIDKSKEYYCDVCMVQVKDGCLSFNFRGKNLNYPLTSILKWENL